jgi:hypothetical protein
MNVSANDKLWDGLQTVSHVRRDGKDALFAYAHPNKAFIPTFDNLSNANWKRVSKIQVNGQGD